MGERVTRPRWHTAPLPSGPRATLPTVLLISCTCSDGDCAVLVEVAAPTVEEAERELCPDCGCLVQVVGVAELVLVHATLRPPAAPLGLAA
jgi:hypothetical protein